jgi:hypothetical protein
MTKLRGRWTLTRPLLIEAIYQNDLTEQELADLVPCSRSFISGCKSGAIDPSPHYRRLIRKHLHRSKEDYPYLFDLDTQPTPRGLAYIMELLRRQFLDMLAKFGLSTALSGSTIALVSNPVIEPQEYLRQASLHLDEAESHFFADNDIRCKLILDAHLPTLKRLADSVTPFQPIAAILAVRALIEDIQLATRDRLFSERELLAIEAIKYAALSSDPSLLALATYWHADTYIYCYRQPERAIPLLTTAMDYANNGPSQLIRSGIAADLAIAHGQQGNERGVLDNITLAYDTMPSSAVLDSHSRFTDTRESELLQWESKAYTELSNRVSSYGSIAYDRACASLQSGPISSGYHTQALTQKAAAAVLVDDMSTFKRCLLDSLDKSPSYNRVAQIHAVAHRVPASWLAEHSVRSLQRDVSHALTLASR